MEKYDRESNVRKYSGVPRQIIRYLLVLFTLYCMYIVFIATWETRIERASFVGGLVFLAYLMYPAGRFKVKKMNYIPWYDILLAAIAALSYFYFVFNCDQIINQGIRLSTFEIVLGVCGILVTLEAKSLQVGQPSP